MSSQIHRCCAYGYSWKKSVRKIMFSLGILLKIANRGIIIYHLRNVNNILESLLTRHCKSIDTFELLIFLFALDVAKFIWNYWW